MKLKFFSLFVNAAALSLLSVACDNDTLGVGADIMPEGDGVTNKMASFVVKSHTEKFDSVLANTNVCMLGTIIDSETRAKTTCDFLAQFHVMENYAFPDKENMLLDDNGEIIIDSCDLRVYFDSYYGDSLAPMLLGVHELSKSKIMEENLNYYTNINPQDYVDQNSSVGDTVVYAIKDLTKDTLNEVSSSSYYLNMKAQLPKEYGKYLVDKYYESPVFFKNSYNFIHNVCPGFYFEAAGGLGSMVKVKVSTLNVYFRYKTKTAAGNDTIVDGMQRMAATEEVIQNTRISNDIPGDMVNDTTFSYVKSPAALYTVLELPIDEIYAKEGIDAKDDINKASLSIRCYNPSNQGDFNLKAPSTLMMLRKSEMYDFFLNAKVPDGKTAFIANYSSLQNAYDFSNISGLVKQCKEDRATGSEDWNRVVLIPVATEYSTTTDAYGYSTQTLLKVRHDLTLSSARLEGGNTDDLKISVVYSRFGK